MKQKCNESSKICENKMYYLLFCLSETRRKKSVAFTESI